MKPRRESIFILFISITVGLPTFYYYEKYIPDDEGAPASELFPMFTQSISFYLFYS